MTNNISTNPHIKSITYLKKKPNSEYAFGLLQDINKAVSYLMRENGLKVGTLAEFFPKNNNLLGLNVNRGSKIMLRLRHGFDETQFLSRDEVMQTMIHELTHNLYGPHDSIFKNQMKEWCGRQYVIETLGLVNNFLGQGKRLGGKSVSGSYQIRQKRIKLFDSKGNGKNRANVNKTGTGQNKDEKKFTAKEIAARAAMTRLEANIPKKVYEVNKDNDLDEKVDIDEILSQHEIMDSQREDIIIIDSEAEESDEVEMFAENVTSPKSNDLEIIDLT